MKRISFYVHGNVIDKSFTDESLYYLRLASVRVQFQWVANLFDLFAKEDKISIQSWFSARNNYSVQESFVPVQKFVDRLLIQRGMA